MVRKMAFVVAVVFALSLFCAGVQDLAYAKELKVGYVDLIKAFDEYSKTKESSKSVEEKGKIKEEERKRIVDDIKKLKDEQALLSDKAKAEKQALIDNKIKGLQEFDLKARDELLKIRNEAIAGIMKDIEKVVMDYSKEAGYDLILNSRTLLYGIEQLDLTNEIIKRLNKK